jgi:hypothetical protein
MIQQRELSCGCELVTYSDGSGPSPDLRPCPLHAHAEDLLAAARKVYEGMTRRADGGHVMTAKELDEYTALAWAISGAEGKD